MPYTIVRHGKCYQVINKITGQVHAKCATLANAKKQMRLLYAIENGYIPRGGWMGSGCATCSMAGCGCAYCGGGRFNDYHLLRR